MALVEVAKSRLTQSSKLELCDGDYVVKENRGLVSAVPHYYSVILPHIRFNHFSCDG